MVRYCTVVGGFNEEDLLIHQASVCYGAGTQEQHYRHGWIIGQM